MARDDVSSLSLSPWSSGLPPKISAAVLRRLPSHVDRVRFAAVCTAWRAAAGQQPRQPLPWLALLDGTFFSYPCSSALRFPGAARRYHGSSGDCLLLSGGAGDGYMLVHPFSGDTTTMRLPGLSSVRFVVGDDDGVPPAWRGVTDDPRAPKDTAVRKVVMCTCSAGHVVVAAMVGDGRLGKIAVCRPGSDSSWVMSAHDAWRGFTDFAFYDGMVYAVADTGDLFAMPVAVDDVDDSHTGGEPTTVAWARIVIKVAGDAPASRRRQGQEAPREMRYLLVSGGRLLMVHRETVTSDDGATIRFAVFKADLVSERWSEVKSVGDDTALFVGRWTSVSRRVSRYGLPGNRIHFLDDDVFCNGCPAGHQFGSYDMTDGAIHPLLPPLVELGNGAGDTPATWLFPGEQEGAQSWCDLPWDLCGLILRRLPCLEDRVHLSEVCRHWHVCARQDSIVRRRRRRKNRNLTTSPRCQPSKAPAPAAATVVAPPAVAAVAPRPVVAYLALPNGNIFTYPAPTTSHRLVADSAGYLCAACDGWLLFKDDDDDGDDVLRLSSPFTGKTRLLPSLVHLRTHHTPVEIVNEPSPTTGRRRAEWTAAGNDNEAMTVRKLVMCPDDGFIAAIVGREHFGKVALCSLETFSWSVSAHDRWRWYDDLAYFDGRLYAVTAHGDLLAFDVGVDGDTGEPFVSRVERVVVGDPFWRHAKLRYLVPSASSGGDDGDGAEAAPALLMVVRQHHWTHAPLAVLRADLASSRWVRVDRLGHGEALFVGRLCSRSVRARLRAGDGGVRGDQVFFLPDDCVGMSFWEQRTERSRHHAAVYDMLDGSVTDLLPRQMMIHGPAPAAWLFPSSDHDGRE